MSWDEPRCVWCHKTGGTIEPLRVRVPNVPIFSEKEQDIEVLVHAEHKDETRRYYIHLYKNAHTFLWSVLLGTVALMVFAVLGWEPGATAVLIYFGIVLIVFPFSNGATFQVAAVAGIKHTVRFIQVTGAAFIVGGSILLCLS